MKRSTVWGLGVFALVLVAAGCCLWQRDRLAQIGLGVRAKAGDLAADASVSFTMPSPFGSSRCFPQLDAPMRIHREYPDSLQTSADSLVGRRYGVGE
jgi:hypothetical protein